MLLAAVFAHYISCFYTFFVIEFKMIFFCFIFVFVFFFVTHEYKYGFWKFIYLSLFFVVVVVDADVAVSYLFIYIFEMFTHILYIYLCIYVYMIDLVESLSLSPISLFKIEWRKINLVEVHVGVFNLGFLLNSHLHDQCSKQSTFLQRIEYKTRYTQLT